MTRTPWIRNDMVFAMPGLVVEIADQCSGIRSSYVLFITSLLAGSLFLHSTMHRTVIALMFYPLGILPHAARILLIALLTIHVDPNAINGPVHRHGGPPLFVLSLVPFFLVLALLVKAERTALRRRPLGKAGATATTTGGRRP